ncbi:hypothetical protein [Aquibacillus rhizosphaerae]|uniref:Uncharacterized protein n=1 Tax=Aquibacillus rhizosphaerae TaxID=3051431 RepID=A0ABT7L7E6_9BACI|nr:hypothetical protein [Aquibacillus sp. LR5S19]MDL4840520.1 hypothetical protein [Aquibacillus sp. LR5S19]
MDEALNKKMDNAIPVIKHFWRALENKKVEAGDSSWILKFGGMEPSPASFL